MVAFNDPKHEGQPKESLQECLANMGEQQPSVFSFPVGQGVVSEIAQHSMMQMQIGSRLIAALGPALQGICKGAVVWCSVQHVRDKRGRHLDMSVIVRNGNYHPGELYRAAEDLALPAISTASIIGELLYRLVGCVTFGKFCPPLERKIVLDIKPDTKPEDPDGKRASAQ